MKALTCDACGGNLTMTDDGSFAICDFCGTKHTKERIGIKVQEIKGVVEITKGDAEKERLIKNAEKFIVLKEFVKAKKAYEDITTMYPDEWKGWWGLFKLPFEEFLTNGNFYVPQNNFFRNAYTLFLENSKNKCEPFSTFFKNIIYKHGVVLLKEQKNTYTYNYLEKYCIKENFYDISLGECRYSSKLSPITLWFITDSNDVFNIINSDFINAFLKKIRKLYVDEVSVGKLTPIVTNKNYTPIISDFHKINSIDSRAYISNLLKKYGYKSTGTLMEKNKILFDLDETFTFQINWICGNWISITYGYYDLNTNYYFFKNREAISNNRCQHCGNEFKGFIKKVCSKCGKSKDY